MDQLFLLIILQYMYIFYIFVSYFDLNEYWAIFDVKFRQKNIKLQKVCILLGVNHTPNTGEGE